MTSVKTFDKKATTWDQNPERNKLVENTAKIISRTIEIAPDFNLLDYGSGTGLLGFQFIDKAQSVTFCDTSEGMLEQVKKKRDAHRYENVNILKTDFLSDDLPQQRFDVIASMLVLHHINNLDVLLSKFNQALHAGGYFCWIDMDEEDGSFHSNNEGIAHFGFSRKIVEKLLHENGFAIHTFDSSLKYRKETKKGEYHFPIFVAIAQKL